jgi:O-antigen/teichoic acid export membrane protein
MSRLTAGRLLARNTLYNLVGQAAPMLVAVLAIPLLIDGMGAARFGVLSLAWIGVGYFSLFDLGLGRALTQFIAERLGSDREGEIPAATWTALLLMLLLGLVGAVLLAAVSPWLVRSTLDVPAELRSEALHTFYLLAAALPFVISTAALRGILEAQQRFGIVNAVRVPMGVFTFLGPLLVLPLSVRLEPVVGALVAARVVAWGVHLYLCLRFLPELRRQARPEVAHVRGLLRFGGWLTVTNVVSPIMVYLDRFLIGALLSVAAVAYYVTPYEVVIKLWLVPSAIAGVLFPAFSASFVHEPGRAALLLERGLKAVWIAMFPVALVLVVLAREGLTLWLGAEFAGNSIEVLQWLALGLFINALAQIPFTFIQAAGRPDLTAKLHLLELPFYLTAVWMLTRAYGIQGTAMAWTARIALDTLALFIMTALRLPAARDAIVRLGAVALVSLVVLGLGMVAAGGALVKGAMVLASLGVFAAFAWVGLLDAGERAAVVRLVRSGARGEGSGVRIAGRSAKG